MYEIDTSANFRIADSTEIEILKEEITKFAYLLDKAIFKYHVKQ